MNTTTDLVALSLAAGASMMFAAANNLQRSAAVEVPVDAGGPVRLLLRLLGTPRWLMGSAFALAALALHAVALARGGVILVQSVLSAGLVLALAVEAVRERRRLRPGEFLGACLLVTGVVLVLAGGRPAGGRPVGFSVQALALGVLLLVVAMGLTCSRVRSHPHRTATMMAAAAGACFAVDAVFLKGVSNWLYDMDALPALTCVAGFVVASFLGNLLVQRAYQRAPLRVVLPAMTAADPLAAFAVGHFILGESVQSGRLPVAAVVVGLVSIVAGIVMATTRVPSPVSKGRVVESVNRPACPVSYSCEGSAGGWACCRA
jgi:drug/metabolite transporter (DMT)-like permease